MNHSDLLAAHKRAIQIMLSATAKATGPERRKAVRLRTLQRRRLALEAQLKERGCVVHETLRERLLQEEQQRKATLESAVGDQACKKLASLPFSSVQVARLRHQESLRVSYKLAGVSVEQPDPETLQVRLDVYGSVYHCFFQMVAAGRSNQQLLFLKLTQHTLPRGVNVEELVQQHLQAPVGTRERFMEYREKSPFLNVLRQFVQTTYHCCCSLSVRIQAFRYLEGLSSSSLAAVAAKTSSSSALDQDVLVQNLEATAETYRKVSFHVSHRRSGMEKVLVSVFYPRELTRPKSHRPVTVKIKVNSVSNRRLPMGMVSDIEDDYEEFTETAIRAFKKLPMEEAMGVVTRAMTDW